MNIAQITSLADMWDGVGAGWMALMMVVMVLFWGAIIFGIVWLIRGAARGWPAPAEKPARTTENPLQVLERRFAEGAITVADYRERREVLGNGTAEAKGAYDEEPLTTPRAGGGSQ